MVGDDTKSANSIIGLGVMQIQNVHPNYVQQLWPSINTMLERALEHSGGEYSAEQLRMMLVRGEQVLLIANGESGIVGAATIAFENYPNDRIAFITAIGGRLIAKQSLFDELKEWCRQQGCTKIRGAAREAVARLWHQKFGIEERYRIVEAPL